MNIPTPFSLWRHHAGDSYVVIDVANYKDTYDGKFPATVVYRSQTTGKLWARPLTQWHDSFQLIEEHPTLPVRLSPY